MVDESKSCPEKMPQSVGKRHSRRLVPHGLEIVFCLSDCHFHDTVEEIPFAPEVLKETALANLGNSDHRVHGRVSVTLGGKFADRGSEDLFPFLGVKVLKEPGS